jgi:hypothetical protein
MQAKHGKRGKQAISENSRKIWALHKENLPPHYNIEELGTERSQGTIQPCWRGCFHLSSMV